jgi:hypothetical protein
MSNLPSGSSMADAASKIMILYKTKYKAKGVDGKEKLAPEFK